jgi:S-DNA-T family DNA segregation ATPase FtsK/SpoIIIE
MAKTVTKPRRAVRASRPRNSGAKSRPRAASRPPAGRRRQGPSLPEQLIAWLLRVESFGMAIVLVACLAIGSLFASTSPLDGVIKSVGLHAVTAALALAGLGALLWTRHVNILGRHPRILAALLVLLPFSAGLLGLFHPGWQLGANSLAVVSAGGKFGEALVGEPLGVALWLMTGAIFIAIAWPRAALATLERTPGAVATVWQWRIPQRLASALSAVLDFAFPTKPPHEAPNQAAPSWLPPEFDEEEAGPSAVPAMAPEPQSEPEIPDTRLRQGNLPMWMAEEAPAEEEPPAPVANPAWMLPPMEIFAGQAPAEESAKPDNALRSSLIVETLASFGVDARVAAFHEGPVVTQFDIEPGWEVKYKSVVERDKEGKPLLDKDGRQKTHSEEVSRTRIRVNQITSLSNDLALALAAPSLRIEAPVPGRSVVGIEVPNSAASVVTLRSVIETPAFQRLAVKTKLALPLGKSVSGEPVVADLARMPHLLIAGATGSGKSSAINSIIASLLMQARPEDVRFVMIDPKRVELAGFAMIPHLAFSNIVVDVEKVVGTLGAVLHEMEARYKRFASLAVRNIDAFNKHPRISAVERLPYWVVIIDELADLMMAAPFEVERQICRLAQLARATGIHLVVATQRPSVDVVTGLIKANFPTRIAFAMTSQVDSRTILDMAGAERLLGRGDMLYLPTDASKPKRVQGVFVSDAEIDRLVAFWAQQRTTHPTPIFDHLLEQAEQAMQDEEDADPMYDRAKALAEEHTRISTSMLQRRLRIGYPRAARIMERLEDEGIVGSGDRGGSREVVPADNDDFHPDPSQDMERDRF